MLKLVNIKKDYIVADAKVAALKGITINFRANEFVSILGPSGCGKTTMLNIIGGLDKYTSGDLVINGVSTKKYNDRNWDVYRNHRIGFIFQSYNLIPHQTVLENVELALTIAGLEKSERIKRAKNALDKVGLSDQYSKKPNQLSGGQCQRVAIARALVNEPDILLADEPTGALDTQTSVQIMDLIKQISSEKLVIMVTHNPDLANKYSTRIVNLLDGEICKDSNPCSDKEEQEELERIEKDKKIIEELEVNTQIKTKKKKKEKAKMSLWTAFKLSARNLMSKFRRTLMVGLAGSIGIIGVSCVLAISSGITDYIDTMQEDMLSGNPITITETTYDLNAMMGSMSNLEQTEIVIKEGIVSVNSILESLAKRAETMESIMVSNDISQDYLDYLESIPKEYLEEISYNYGIDVSNNIYTDFQDCKNGESKETSLSVIKTIYSSMLKNTEYGEMSALIATLQQAFGQALSNEEYLLHQYDLKAGKVAKEKDEIMIVVNKDSQLADLTLAQLGYYTQEEFLNMAFKSFDEEKYKEELSKEEFSYEELLGKKFYYYPNNTVFNKKVTNIPANPITGTEATTRVDFTYNPYADSFTDEGIELKVVGILQPKDEMNYGSLSNGFYYTKALTEYILEVNKNSEIATYIRDDNQGKDLQSGQYTTPMGAMDFGITYKYEYIKDLDTYEKETNVTGYVGSSSMASIMSGMMSGMMGGAGGSSQGGATTGQSTPSIYTLSLRQVGGAELPSTISIYPVDFELKEHVLDYLDDWNDEDKDITLNGKLFEKGTRSRITYTDTLSIVISMINTMIDVVTTALVIFTAISLVVSTVMIGIITYVSVVERTKEIGVIRSLGGSKKDVGHLFNAETLIIGLVAGLLGIGITYLLSMFANVIIGKLTGIYTLAALKPIQAIIMVVISVLLTSISGLTPAKAAARMDPVNALRSE